MSDNPYFDAIHGEAPRGSEAPAGRAGEFRRTGASRISAKARHPKKAAAASRPARPVMLALKLALVIGLAAVFAVGTAQPLATFFRLLEMLLLVAAALSYVLALGGKAAPRLTVYSHWHEAAALALAGTAAHLAPLALH